MANKTKNDLTPDSTLSAVKPYDVVYRNWLIMSIVLLFLGLGVVIFQADGALSREAYWQPQVDTFLWLNNHVMTVIPRDIWGNISMLGDTSVLLMALSPILLYRPQIWLTMIAAVSGVAWVNRCHRGWLALLSGNGLLLISALLYICSFVLFLRAYIGVSSGWQMLIIAGVCGVSVASVLLVQQIIALGNAVAVYYMHSYHVILDRAMMGNVLNTQGSEVADLLHINLLFYLFFLGVIPAVLLLKTRLRVTPWLRLKSLIATVIVALSLGAWTYTVSDTWLWFDKHAKHLGGKVLPWSYVINTVRYAVNSQQMGQAKSYGHHHIFHSVMGALGLESEIYHRQRDIFAEGK